MGSILRYMVTKATQQRIGAAPSLGVVLAIGAFLWLGLWAKDDIATWARTWLIKEPAPQALELRCVVPSEFETLLIFVRVDADGLVRAHCGPAGGAGAYTRGKSS